jgi:hypothetical protein
MTILMKRPTAIRRLRAKLTKLLRRQTRNLRGKRRCRKCLRRSRDAARTLVRNKVSTIDSLL